MKKLNHYSLEEVIDLYEINVSKNTQALQHWLSVSELHLSDWEGKLIQDLPTMLLEWENTWNEEELKMYFISPIIRVAHLNEVGVLGTYFERTLKGVVENYAIHVIVDCMVATPKKSGSPNAPYFFLQEFKRSKGDTHDPEGQMLSVMILAQTLNQDGRPIYGGWIQGRFWYFTQLIGKNYVRSQPFDAADLKTLHHIIAILRKLKSLILERHV